MVQLIGKLIQHIGSAEWHVETLNWLKKLYGFP